MMNRNAEGMDYGDPCAAAVIGGLTPDRSATIFIAESVDYDGGELMTQMLPGGYRSKLSAADLVLSGRRAWYATCSRVRRRASGSNRLGPRRRRSRRSTPVTTN